MKKQLTDWRLWLRGLIGAVVGGGANAVTVMVVAPDKFNLAEGGAVLAQFTLVSALVSGALYLKQAPVPPLRALVLVPLFLAGLGFGGCATTGGTVTDRQTLVANAVEDTLAIGLVPVLAKNPDYVPVAQGISVGLGSFTGQSLTAGDVEAFLLAQKLAPDDARTVAALVNAAWDTYTRRYSAQVNAQVRPDVRLFLGAVSAGVNRALAALPK